MSLTFAPEVEIGRDAGWILAFHQIVGDRLSEHPFELSRDDYYADISASLPGALEGGSYRFVIEGITAEDYDQIDQRRVDALNVVRLYLYYRDLEAPDFGAGTNLLGSDFINAGVRRAKAEKHRDNLVAELRVVSVERRAGARNYEAVIEARELVFDLVQERRPCGHAIDLKKADAAAGELMRRAWPSPTGSVPFQFHAPQPRRKPAPPAPPKSDAEDKADFHQPILGLLQSIDARLQKENDKFGRGMLLVRDGKLHVGERPIPLTGGKPKKLDLSQGLLEITPVGRLERDPNYDLCAHSYKPGPVLEQYRLTLRGRGDLKPGDLVAFDAPGNVSGVQPPAGGAFGALGDVGASIKSFFGDEFENPVQLYINSVEHRLSRTSGFITTLTGVQLGAGDPLTDPDELWDHHSPLAKPAEPARRAARATVEESAADAVVSVVRRLTGQLTDTDIGEVRSFGPGQQTSTVFRGTAPLETRNRSRLAEIKRPSDAPADGVPYLTPFAWGRCGLVLPRYPGMRVALAHANHQSDDPIDMGAIWQTGHAPTEARAGDWWLSLPAGNSAGNAPADDKSGDPTDYAGPVTDDLIDAVGNRVIQAGALVIRIGESTLKQAGARPANPPVPNSVTIEHPATGAKIQIRDDGTIEIAGGIIQLKATNQVSIEAPSVLVECQSMEVA